MKSPSLCLLCVVWICPSVGSCCSHGVWSEGFSYPLVNPVIGRYGVTCTQLQLRNSVCSSLRWRPFAGFFQPFLGLSLSPPTLARRTSLASLGSAPRETGCAFFRWIQRKSQLGRSAGVGGCRGEGGNPSPSFPGLSSPLLQKMEERSPCGKILAA